jgi:bifunctional non-homologous end joining protein LigD
MLTKLLTPIPHGIMLSESIEGDGATVFRHACELGVEGIVSKWLESLYRAGRSTDWLKIKNPDFRRR